MNLSTLKYYINKEKLPIQRIFINFEDWYTLIDQLEKPIIHVRNWVVLDNISIHKNLHQPINWAIFVTCNGNPKEDNSYSHYSIEILTYEEKLIKNIIE